MDCTLKRLESVKNFVIVRLNKDTLCNFVFWMGMTCWVYFSMPAHPMVALSSLIVMPFLIKKLSTLKVVEVRAELILEYPDTNAYDLDKNMVVRLKNKELPAKRECLANSEGKIVSDGAPYLFFAAISPFAIGVPLLLILEKSLEIDPPAFVCIATFFLIPTAIFEVCDRPISLLFDSRAWYLQGWRSRRGSFSNSSSNLFSNSGDRYYSPSYSHLSCNIHNHHR